MGRAHDGSGAWTMQTDLCPVEGWGSYKVFLNGATAHLVGDASCWSYSHHADYTFPLSPQADGSLGFDSEFAHLRVDAGGQLLAYEEFNDIFGSWIRFAPGPPQPCLG